MGTLGGHTLDFRALDIQNGDEPELATIWLDIHNPFGPAEVRGSDLVIRQKPGQTAMTRVKHRRIIELRGFVRGIGADEVERAQSFREASEALQAVMDFSLAPGTLTAFAPYLGLPTGSESSIECRAVDAIPGLIQHSQAYQRWSFKLLAIGNPPEWVLDESPS